MLPRIYYKWPDLLSKLSSHLYLNGNSTKSLTWQGVEGKEMWEILNVCFSIQNAQNMGGLKPNLPWAEEHFTERVSGVPYNPPPSHKNWPFAQQNNSDFINGGKFSHTYPERFWPKSVGVKEGKDTDNWGLRFPYGDLDDVLKLLTQDRYTRQAYLPIWFPEDTGVTEGQRVPCSIGYHFQIRGDYVHCHYTLRSCDFLLHFEDDMYLAIRLMQYLINNVNIPDLQMGILTVSIDNLHCFKANKEAIKFKWSKLW